MARKWLNIQSGADEFHSDYAIRGEIFHSLCYLLIFFLFFIFYI